MVICLCSACFAEWQTTESNMAHNQRRGRAVPSPCSAWPLWYYTLLILLLPSGHALSVFSFLSFKSQTKPPLISPALTFQVILSQSCQQLTPTWVSSLHFRLKHQNSQLDIIGILKVTKTKLQVSPCLKAFPQSLSCLCKWQHISRAQVKTKPNLVPPTPHPILQ